MGEVPPTCPGSCVVCGRFTLASPPAAIQVLFGLPEPPDILRPRYNVAPAQLVAVVGLKGDGTTRGLVMLSWGLVRSWANDPGDGPRPINARAETLLAKP